LWLSLYNTAQYTKPGQYCQQTHDTDRILARKKVSTNLEEILSMLLQAFDKPLLQQKEYSK